MKFKKIIALIAIAVCPAAAADIHMEKHPDGVWIMEDERKVFFYRTDGTTGPAKRAGRNHYIHPLMAPDGTTVLTGDSPGDHLHHRGIFWGWSEIFAGDKKVADGWLLHDISWQIKSVTFDAQSDTLDIKVNWLTGKAEEAIIAEHMRVGISETEGGVQKLVFDVDLKALVDGVSIAGVQNTKQYGGFSARLINTSDIIFESDGNKLEPTKDFLEAGTSLNIKYSRSSGLPDVKITCEAEGKPINKWILRNSSSMQNCVWPGREHVALVKGEVTSLRASITLSQE
jgi:hypothetical protein